MSIEVNIARMGDEGCHLCAEEPVSVLELADGLAVRPEGLVQYDLWATLVADELIVRGRLGAGAQFRCSRCGEWFPKYCSNMPFERVIPLPDRAECVDLTPEIREAIILAFPPYPVCRQECKGLCSMCGKNLNKETCSCKPASDSRWGELDDLEIKD